MSMFKNKHFHGHEQVVFCNDHKTGLKAIIAIHNTERGPALGGCRMYPYASEEDALTDVLRLSLGMTYKSAMANLNLGGGKTVIIGDPKKHTTEAMFRSLGRFLNGLNGRYITAEDSGTNLQQMEWIKKETDYVVGIPTNFGGTGDPSPSTAHGNFVGIKAAVKKAFGKDELSGLKIAVQGVGNVGYHLCKELYENDVKLFVSDVNETALKRAVDKFNAVAVAPDKIYSTDVDVYAPCALGATINDKTIPQLKCSIIAGSANNQLENLERHGNELKKRKILYAPDYVISAGGVIHVYPEVQDFTKEQVNKKIEGIHDTLLQVFNLAEEKNIPTYAAANEIAETRILA